jgi:acyl-coenzyme A synthetase/AMP-(fatty) acid ligase
MMRVASLEEVFSRLDRLAVERRDATALAPASGRPMTFGTLSSAVTAAATRLRSEGLRQGDSVSFSVRPSIASIVLILAVVRAGGIVVAADPGMGVDVFNARMAMVRPAFVMAESLLYALSASSLFRWLPAGRRLQLPQLGRMPECRFVRVGRWLPGVPPSLDAAHLIDPPTTIDPVATREPEDPVFIVFTSGTTSSPRTVVHTARSVAAMIDAARYVSELDTDSVVVTDQLHSVLPALLAGSTVVLPAPERAPANSSGSCVRRTQRTPSPSRRICTGS